MERADRHHFAERMERRREILGQLRVPRLIVRRRDDDAFEVEIHAVEITLRDLAHDARGEGGAVVVERAPGLGPIPVTSDVVVDAK